MRPLDPRLIDRAREVRTLLVADVALGVVVAVLVLVQATVLADVITRGFDGAGAGALWLPLGVLVLCFAARGLVGWSFEVAGRRAATTVLSKLRLGVVQRRLSYRPGWLGSRRSGELATAAVYGAVPLEAYFGKLLPQMVLACIVPVVVIVWVAVIDPASAGIMLLTLPLVPVFMILIGTYTRRRTDERRAALEHLGGHFLDVVRGLPTLRALNRGGTQAESIELAGERYRSATMATLRVAFLSGAVLELAATVGVALVAVTVGVRLDGGDLGLRPALTVLILAPELYVPLRTVGTLYHTSADGLAVAETLLPESEPVPAAPAALPLAPPPGAVSVEGVSVTYPGRAEPALDEVNLHIAPGELVAVVGPSGSGKSTLAAALMGLLDLDAGRVTVDGADLAACDPDSWRAHLAWVPQRPLLIPGSIAQNIRLGAPAAADADVRAAAVAAGAAEFIAALPDGYDTRVGEGGRTLSAGQRQRLAIARALARDARLVILDEPTANLDPEAAAAVTAAVERLAGERSVLVISHDPEAVERADRIVHLVNGRIVSHTAEVAS